MKHFWVITYIDASEQIRTKRFTGEDAARAAWDEFKYSWDFSAGHPLFLDEVNRQESTI